MAKKKQALPFKRGNHFLADPEDLYLEITPGQRHYDPRSLLPPDEAHVVGIMEIGVKETLIVELVGDKVTVVDGRRRVVNTREANRRLEKEGLPKIMVPVKHERGDQLKMLKIMVATNEHRRSVDPVGQAKLMQQYVDMGYTAEDVGQSGLWTNPRTGEGLDVQTVKKRLRLLDLCQEVQDAVSTGKITLGKADKLVGKSLADQKAALNGAGSKPKKKKVYRPSKKKIKKVLDSGDHLPVQVRAAIRWLSGEITDEEAFEAIKGLKKALEAEGSEES